MAEKWYMARGNYTAGREDKGIRLYLTAAEWAVVEGLAREEEWSLSRTMSAIVSDWLKRTTLTEAEVNASPFTGLMARTMVRGGKL